MFNRKTGHRIKYAKVDADTGEEVANEDIVKGYKIDTDTFIEVTKEELDEVALESIEECVNHTGCPHLPEWRTPERVRLGAECGLCHAGCCCGAS